MVQQYRFYLPPRKLQQANILRDIYNLLNVWSFPRCQRAEITLGVCEAGFRELRALDQVVISNFFESICGPGVHVNIISHAELKGDVHACSSV